MLTDKKSKESPMSDEYIYRIARWTQLSNITVSIATCVTILGLYYMSASLLSLLPLFMMYGIQSVKIKADKGNTSRIAKGKL